MGGVPEADLYLSMPSELKAFMDRTLRWRAGPETGPGADKLD